MGLQNQIAEMLIEEDEIIRDLTKRKFNIYACRMNMILSDEEKRVMELIDRQTELRKEQLGDTSHLISFS